MKTSYFYSIIFVIIMILIPAFLCLFIKLIPQFEQPPLLYAIRVYGPIKLLQGFKSNADNLAAFGFSIKNPLLQNKHDINFNLIDQSGKIIRRAALNGSVIDDGKFIKVEFIRIPDSANKQYQLEITSAESDDKDSLEIYASNKIPPSYNDLLVNGAKVEGGLSFVPYYESRNPLQQITNIYSATLRRLWADTIFGFLYTTILICLIAYYFLMNRAK